jgi:hypothetical protein
MNLWNWFWRKMGYRKVWLQDFDGELNCRWATPLNLKGVGQILVCNRYDIVFRCIVHCLPDGSVKGRSYVKRWYEEVEE